MDEPAPLLGPPLARPPGLSIARAIALCAIFYVIFSAAGIVVNLPFYFDGPPSEWPPAAYWLTPIPFLVAWLGTIKLGLQWARLSFREACPLTRFPLRIVPSLFAIALAATILFVELDSLIPMPEFFRESFGAFAQVPLLAALLLAVVIAPVAEELFFRGLLFRAFLGRYSFTTAVVAATILFAVFHLNPWQGMRALFLGLWAAWLLCRTGSLLPGIIGHAFFNGSGFLLAQPIFKAWDHAAEFGNFQHLPFSLFAVATAVLLTGGYVLTRQLKTVSPATDASRFPEATVP